jgi:hypothetical protein
MVTTITCLGISGDGKVVVYGKDTKFFINETEISDLAVPSTTVESTAVNHDGSRVLAGGVIPQITGSVSASLQGTSEVVKAMFSVVAGQGVYSVALWSEWDSPETYNSNLHVYKDNVSFFSTTFTPNEVFTNLTISQDGSRMVTVENTYLSSQISGSKITIYMTGEVTIDVGAKSSEYFPIDGTEITTEEIITGITLSDDGQWLFVGTGSKCSAYDLNTSFTNFLTNDSYTWESVHQWDFTVQSLACKNGTLVIGTGGGYTVKVYSGNTWKDHSSDSTVNTGHFVALSENATKLVVSTADGYTTVNLEYGSSSSTWVIWLVCCLLILGSGLVAVLLAWKYGFV